MSATSTTPHSSYSVTKQPLSHGLSARLLAQNTAYRHMERHQKQVARTFAFPVDEAWPPDIKKWATKWSMNPIGLPCPICQDEHGLLNQDDIDIWLWLRAVVPEHNPKGVFNHTLWPIF